MKFAGVPIIKQLQKHARQHPRFAWTLSILWLLLIGWLAFLWNLGSIGLIDETEPLFAEAARQMTVTGDWITPYFNGDTRFDKPPLIYWLMVIGYQLLGVNTWAARLPSALAAIALTILSFYTLRYFGVPSSSVVPQEPTSINRTLKERQLWFCAWLGSTIVALNPEIILAGRTGFADMLLTTCMAGAMLAFFLGYAASKPAAQARWYLAFYVLIALAVLAKGPLALILPGLVIIAFVFYLGNARQVLQEMRLLRGSLIFTLIALPWYVLVTWRNGEAYIDSFFVYHNLERFTSVIHRHAGPWYIYFPVLLVGFAPWCIYLPVAIAQTRFWQRAKWRKQPRSTHLGLFAVFWFVIIFVFFSIAVTKRPNYVLPLIPAAAILVALLWSDEKAFLRKKHTLERTKRKITFYQLCSILNIVFLLAYAGAIFFSPDWMGYNPYAPNVRQALQQSSLPLWGGIIWAATAIGAALLLLRRQERWLWSVNLVGFLAFLIFVMQPTLFLFDRELQLPLRQLAAIAVQQRVQQPNEELIMIGFKKPSLVFYTQQPVTYITNPKEVFAYINKKAVSQPQPPSVMILSQPSRLKEAGLQPYQYQDLGNAGAYQLIRVPLIGTPKTHASLLPFLN